MSASTDVFEWAGQRYLGGRTSDPRELGWMRGAPPPPDKRITFEDDNFFTFPQIRWALSHMRELTATVSVPRCPDRPSPLDRSDRTAEINALTFVDLHGRTRRFEDALYDTYADGIMVLHRGRVVYERYFGALEPQVPHTCHSVTKSYAGTLAAAFVHEGVLDDAQTIPDYLPELRGTAWDDATLRHVMDMQTSLAYSEEYTDESAGIWEYARACGWRRRPAGYDGPATLPDYLRTVRKEGPHGQALHYKTVNTEVMAWVMARVTGRSFAQLLHERLWSPLGCEDDGYLVVDAAGMAAAGAGLSASLRDLARFGELMRREGEWNGKQLIPASVVDDVRHGDHAAGERYNGLDFTYRSQWWIPHDDLDAFEAQGIHGQRLYIAPKAEMVMARFASHPVAVAEPSEPITRPQMLALARMLQA